MKRILIFLLLVNTSVAFAQSSPETEATPEAEIVEPAKPCVAVDEIVPTEDGQAELPADSTICPEPDPEAAPVEDSLATGQADEVDPALEALAAEDEMVEATADEVFRPGEEILEDYPVPLPSDI